MDIHNFEVYIKSKLLFFFKMRLDLGVDCNASTGMKG